MDASPVHFVRPLDTNRPTWVAYEGGQYLGTVHAQFDTGRHWHVQSLREQHLHLDDAVRALRRPATWPDDQERVRRWAHSVLGDHHLVVLDVQTTALNNPWAVQIGLTDRHGNVLFNEHLNPLADIAPEAAALHGITADQAAAAPPFGTFVPRLSRLLRGHRCLSYNAPFDSGVLKRELLRHLRSTTRACSWLDQCTWVDAMRPYAAWKGLWSAHRRDYRYQPLGGSYEAVTNCRILLATLERIRW
ncbi:3'-5' exonuclease [Streptomyces sp. NPDC048417]|uniref:3'-5' exonuclease n=1 Tax=Streptomyces sp. NPDC048417 TaxID=3155387 RepID=UPI0034198B39